MGTKIAAKVSMPAGCYIVKTSDFTGKYDIQGRKVWEHKSSEHPYYMIWDELHGEIEVFDKTTLKHYAVYHPNGNDKSGAVRNRILKFRGG